MPSLLSLALRPAAVASIVMLLGCQATSSTAPDTTAGNDAGATTLVDTDNDCRELESSALAVAEAVADLDGDGQSDTVFAADSQGSTVLRVCGTGTDVATFAVGNTNKPVQVHPIDIEADGASELLIGTTTGAGPFAGTLLRLVDGELVDQRVDLAVIPPRASGTEGQSFGCADIDGDGITELVSVAYELDAAPAAAASTVRWSQTTVLGEAAGITRQGVFDIGAERAFALTAMNGTCRDQTLIVGVANTDLAAPTSSAGPPSQSAADARRDDVVLALAELPYEARVDPLLTVEAEEGTWILSRLTRDVIDASMADGCSFGDRNGDDPSEIICTLEYGEILLVEATGEIQRAYPMPGAVPSWIHLTPSRIYAGRIGDGGLPASTLVRVDRANLAATVVLIPTGIDDTDLDLWPASWRVAAEEQVATYSNVVGFAPEMTGTNTSSWIGDVVIDRAGIDSLIDEN